MHNGRLAFCSDTEREAGDVVTARSAKRLLAHGWLYVPAAAGPIGGGMIKIGGGNSWAAVAVGVAPYAVCLLLYLVFVIGYLAAVTRYLCSDHAGQEAMERLITVSANSVVAILTLKRAGLPGTPGDMRSLRSMSDEVR
jgi:hypothetical protein